MSRTPPDPPIAHVFAPRFPDDVVEVIGNQRGLTRLINALIDAISAGRGVGEVCTIDGKGSGVRATCLEGVRRPEEWQRSGSPYWDIEDPLIARILDLTEETSRLRQAVASLRRERKSILQVDYLGGTGAAGAGNVPAG